MNRRFLLIAACCFAAASAGLNIRLMLQRQEKPASPAPAAPAPAAAAALQPVHMDFSGTAFADDSWKLQDAPPPEGRLDQPLKLEAAPAAPPPSPPVSPSAP